MTRKVCIVNPYQHGGGAEYQIKCIIDELSKTGEFEFYYLAHHIEPDLPTNGYTAVQIGEPGDMPKIGYMADVLCLYRQLKALKPDVVYQRVACGYTGIAAYYAKKNNIPMIWHVAHDTDVTPGSAIYGRHPVRRFLEKRSVEYGIRNASGIITQTDSQAATMLEHYGVERTEVIANFHPSPNEVIDKSGPLQVLWIANVKPWKRPEAFVRLAQALSDLKNVQFVMVGAPPDGSGDQAWGEALLNSIADTPNLDYRGQLAHDAVNELLAKSHLFVNTSEQEGFPNTFIQSWMREMPVVSLSVDPDDILETAKIGVHAVTEERLADAVRELMTNQPKRQEYAERAKAHVEEKHSLNNAMKLAHLFKQDRNAAS